MDEYRKYLATKVVNEDAIINYRQLSRALKVHTHLAKQMLYDFHHTQTAKKPGCVHATYLVTGILRHEPQPASQATNGLRSQLDEDTHMPSSPFPSSYPEPEPAQPFDNEDAEPAEDPFNTTTVLLVREEELEDAKTDFEEIQSIFVYSLEPGPLNDFQLLTQCNREVAKEFWTEDPLKAYPTYGLVTNKNVRRRTGTRPSAPSVPLAASTGTKVSQAKNAPIKEATAVVKKEEPAKPAGSAKPATLKRQSSDLFKSFAKSKPPKLKATDSNASSALAEDEPMAGMSEDEAASDIDEEMLEAEAEKAQQARKARKEREAKLREMMDEEEGAEEEEEEVDNDEEMGDAEVADEGAESAAEPVDESAALDKQEEPEKKEEVSVSNGRRRGKRKVMKKRTYQDEDGYLVTKEEAAWESFSEDEPEPKKPKINFPSAQAAKKGGAASKGQGNIMNFFKKK